MNQTTTPPPALGAEQQEIPSTRMAGDALPSPRAASTRGAGFPHSTSPAQAAALSFCSTVGTEEKARQGDCGQVTAGTEQDRALTKCLCE